MTEQEFLGRLGGLSTRGMRLVVATATALEAGDVTEAVAQVNDAQPRSTVGEALLIAVGLLSCTCDALNTLARHVGDTGDVEIETYEAYLQRIGMLAARIEAGPT